MNIGIIVFNLFRLVIAAAIGIVLLVHIFRKKRLFDYSDIRDATWRKKAMSHAKAINVVAILISCALLVAVIRIGVPITRDVPYMMRGEYLTVEGTVLSNSMGGAANGVRERDFIIKDSAMGAEITVHALSTGLKEGEYVRVTYLPNSGLATINERR